MGELFFVIVFLMAIQVTALGFNLMPDKLKNKIDKMIEEM